ncbi:MAG: hypothetical protein ABIH25_03665 [Candidatus Woesearchaeota archaeon]
MPENELIKDRRNFIYVPQTNRFVNYNQAFNDLTLEESIRKAKNLGFSILQLSTLIPHLINLRDATEGKITLYDGLGTSIPKSKSKEIFDKYFPFCGKGLDIILDVYFQKGTGFKNLELVANSRPIFTEKRNGFQRDVIPLEECLMENNILVDLTPESFNSQGFPIKKSKIKTYERGKNVYYWHPIENSSVWFSTEVGGSSINCERDINTSDSILGVLLCINHIKK